MRDKGIDKGLILSRDDAKRSQKGWDKGFFGFRKMFRDYLEKLNVAFFDACCPEATAEGIFPVRFNGNPEYQRLEYFNGTAWVDISQIHETTTTTTTTTSTSTTSTTTAP